ATVLEGLVGYWCLVVEGPPLSAMILLCFSTFYCVYGVSGKTAARKLSS
ncbi:hypothetical protein A2U01_0055757, partial [Trifolium medium]|nr:hypothetical protein [Trifolium medium]